MHFDHLSCCSCHLTSWVPSLTSHWRERGWLAFVFSSLACLFSSFLNDENEYVECLLSFAHCSAWKINESEERKKEKPASNNTQHQTRFDLGKRILFSGDTSKPDLFFFFSSSTPALSVSFFPLTISWTNWYACQKNCRSTFFLSLGLARSGCLSHCWRADPRLIGPDNPRASPGLAILSEIEGPMRAEFLFSFDKLEYFAAEANMPISLRETFST